METFLAYDLGGTKVATGIVNKRGQLLYIERNPVDPSKGPTTLLNQLTEIGLPLLKRFPKTRRVGFASAGPLDAVKGILLDPTNFFANGKSWGRLPLAAPLSRKLGRPVFMENDAAAAALAEKWQGSARRTKNFALLTLGTGLGTGFFVNDALVRSRGELHPEGGHLILRAGDRSAPCGCGNSGCAESYLSGVNFAKRFSRSIHKQMDAKEITKLAKAGDSAANQAFSEYAEMFALFLHNIAVLFAPERIILTGSFASASALFVPRARKLLAGHLSRRRDSVDLVPKISLSTLKNSAGVIGAAHVAMHRTM